MVLCFCTNRYYLNCNQIILAILLQQSSFYLIWHLSYILKPYTNNIPFFCYISITMLCVIMFCSNLGHGAYMYGWIMPNKTSLLFIIIIIINCHTFLNISSMCLHMIHRHFNCNNSIHSIYLYQHEEEILLILL